MQGRAASERAKVSEVDDGESVMKVGQCAKCEQALRAVVSCTGKERRAGEEHGTGQEGGQLDRGIVAASASSVRVIECVKSLQHQSSESCIGAPST